MEQFKTLAETVAPRRTQMREFGLATQRGATCDSALSAAAFGVSEESCAFAFELAIAPDMEHVETLAETVPRQPRQMREYWRTTHFDRTRSGALIAAVRGARQEGRALAFEHAIAPDMEHIETLTETVTQRRTQMRQYEQTTHRAGTRAGARGAAVCGTREESRCLAFELAIAPAMEHEVQRADERRKKFTKKVGVCVSFRGVSVDRRGR